MNRFSKDVMSGKAQAPKRFTRYTTKVRRCWANPECSSATVTQTHNSRLMQTTSRKLGKPISFGGLRGRPGKNDRRKPSIRHVSVIQTWPCCLNPLLLCLSQGVFVWHKVEMLCRVFSGVSAGKLPNILPIWALAFLADVHCFRKGADITWRAIGKGHLVVEREGNTKLCLLPSASSKKPSRRASDSSSGVRFWLLKKGFVRFVSCCNTSLMIRMIASFRRGLPKPVS